MLSRSEDHGVDRLEIYPGFASEVPGDAEHAVQLVVAAGPVTAATAEETTVLQTGASITVVPGDTVRLENPGEGTVVVIRVAC